MAETLVLSESQCRAVVAHFLAHPDQWTMTEDGIGLGTFRSAEDEFSGHSLRFHIFAIGMWDSFVEDLDSLDPTYSEEEFGPVGRFHVSLSITDKNYDKIGSANGDIISLKAAKVLRSNVAARQEAARHNIPLKTTIIRVINDLNYST